MHCLWKVLAFVPLFSVSSLFTDIERRIVMDLVKTYNPAYVEIIDNDLSWALDFNETFIGREMILTGVVTVAQLIEALPKHDHVHYGGVSLVVLHEDTPVWSEFLESITAKILRSSKWVLLSRRPFSAQSFGKVYIPYDCQFISVNQGESLSMLTEVYRISPGSAIDTTHLGYWSQTDGLSISERPLSFRRSNFKNIKFEAIIKNSPPYTYVKTEANGTVVFDGYFYHVWKELEFRLKFTTTFRVINSKDDITSILQKESHSFSVSPIGQDPTSASHVALGEPIYEAKVYLFGNRPGSELEWNSYLKPFSSETWFATLGWVFLSSIAMTIAYRVAWTHNVCENESGHYTFPFDVAFATVFRAICAQGSDVTPRSSSCRLLFLTIYMTALVVNSAFSAALFSLLTIPVSKAPFNSFQDVFNNKANKIGMIPNSELSDTFKEMAERFPNGDHSSLKRVMDATKDMPVSVKEALELICGDKNYVFMWDLPNVLEVLQELNITCREKVMPGGPMVFKETFGFAFSKDNPYKELMDLHLLQLKNEGVLRRLLLNTWPPRIPNVQTSWMLVTLGDISPILYMFSMGVILGCIILMFERLRWWQTHDSKRLASTGQLIRDLGKRMQSTAALSSSSPVDIWENRYTNWRQNSPIRRNKHHYS